MTDATDLRARLTWIETMRNDLFPLGVYASPPGASIVEVRRRELVDLISYPLAVQRLMREVIAELEKHREDR